MTELNSMFKAIVETPKFITNTTYRSVDSGGKYVYHSVVNGGF